MHVKNHNHAYFVAKNLTIQPQENIMKWHIQVKRHLANQNVSANNIENRSEKLFIVARINYL